MIVWIEDLDRRVQQFELPGSCATREGDEAVARSVLPDLIKDAGLRGLRGWGLVDPRARVRR